MKKKLLLVSIILIWLLIVFGCGSAETFDYSKLQLRNGFYYYLNSEKLFSGKVVILHNNGQKHMEFDCNNGQKEGKYTEWYKNGEKKYEIFYKNGNKDGKFSEWYDGGWIKNTAFFIQEQKVDQEINWYEFGGMQSKGTYKENKKNGKYTSFFNDGKKHIELFFENDNLVYEKITDKNKQKVTYLKMKLLCDFINYEKVEIPEYLKTDGWGNDFIYKSSSRKRFVASKGKDGKFNGWSQTGISQNKSYDNDMIFDAYSDISFIPQNIINFHKKAKDGRNAKDSKIIWKLDFCY